MDLLKKAFIGIFAAIIAIVLLTNTLAPAITPVVSLENHTFATNNTYYALSHNPTNNDLRLYYFGNTTYQIPASKVVANTTHVKIYTNGTLDYPNITSGATTFYYASYTYNKNMTIWNLDFGWILIILVIAVVTYIGWQFVKMYF